MHVEGTALHHRFIAAVAATLLLTVTSGYSQQPVKDGTTQDPNAPDAFSMDLDSLANTKVTTASKFSENLSEAPGVMTVVSQDELKRFGGITLGEILDRVAGLNISSNALSDRSVITIDGQQTRGNGGHVLFLINGRPVREVMEGGISTDLLESFPVNALERIEVIKGPGSVLYGSDAFAGVINLVTKKASGESIQFRSAAGAGNAVANSGELLFARGDLNIVAAGQYHQLPLWNTPYNYTTRIFNQAFGENISIRNAGEGAYLGVNYKGFSFMSAYTGFDTSSFAGGDVGDSRWKKGFADLGYSLRAASKWEMQFNFTYTRSTLDIPQFPDIYRDSHQSVAEWTNFVTFSEKDKLTFGTAFDHIQGTETSFAVTPGFIDAQGSRSSISFYAQHEHKLTDDLKLIGGFQANKIGNIRLDVEPRAGVVWSVAPRIALKALYSGAFRAPSLDEMDLNYPSVKGNPNLRPEKIGTFDLLASYQGNRLQSSIRYFRSSLDNLIYSRFNGQGATFTNLASPTQVQGAEWENKYYFKKNWYLTDSALYQTSHDGLPQAVSPLPSISAKAGISYMAKNGLDLGVFDAFRGHISGYASSLNPRPEAFHSVNANLRLDLSKRWVKNDSKGFAVFVHANNLTNQQIWLPDLQTAGMIPFSQGITLFYGIEVWQKKPQ